MKARRVWLLLCFCLQTVAHARMEQQLYGSSSRSREDDSRVISGKSRSLAGKHTPWLCLQPRACDHWPSLRAPADKRLTLRCVDFHFLSSSVGSPQYHAPTRDSGWSVDAVLVSTAIAAVCCLSCCAGTSHDGGEDSSNRRQPRRSEDSKPSRSNSRNTSAAGGNEQRGLRGLFFNILRSRCGGHFVDMNPAYPEHIGSCLGLLGMPDGNSLQTARLMAQHHVPVGPGLPGSCDAAAHWCRGVLGNVRTHQPSHCWLQFLRCWVICTILPCTGAACSRHLP